MRIPAPAEPTRRSFKVLIWATLPVLVLTGVVQTTGVGIDVLVVALGALLLLGLERSIGDWLGEWVGPLAAASIFVVTAVALSWFFLSDSLGRSQTERFFVEAERRGYRTIYYPTIRSAPADQASRPDASSATAPPVTTAGSAPVRTSSASSPAAAASPNPVEASNSGPQPEDEAVPTAVSTTGGDASAGGTRQRSSVLSFLRRGSPADPVATEVVLSLSPTQIRMARRTVISAQVSADGTAVTAGAVEFMINGLGAGRIGVDASGAASTTFSTHIPGTYEVRARYTGGSSYASSRSGPVILTVIR